MLKNKIQVFYATALKIKHKSLVKDQKKVFISSRKETAARFLDWSKEDGTQCTHAHESPQAWHTADTLNTC